VETGGADQAAGGISMTQTLNGGPGNDFLTGTDPGDPTNPDGIDIINGGGSVDVLKGLGGDDIIEGGADSDQMDGGAGFDMLSYAHASGPVAVFLGLGGLSGEAFGDMISGFEGLIGSAFGDVLAAMPGPTRSMAAPVTTSSSSAAVPTRWTAATATISSWAPISSRVPAGPRPSTST
jgi:hypothetical protein